MIKQKDFTFGFELEGIFAESLIAKIKRKYKKIDIDLKGDGSVDDYALKITKENNGNYKNLALDINGDVAQEINVGIFKDFDSLIEILSMFENGKNYWSNRSCGLHIHIKPKTKMWLKCEMFDNTLINKMQNFAEQSLCNEIKTERVNNHYCLPAKTFGKKLQNYKRRAKYTFMGNHPQGTIEFRFLSACIHKVENAKKFFNFIFAELNKMKAKEKKIWLIENINQNINFDNTISQENQKFNETITIEKTIKTTKLCV